MTVNFLCCINLRYGTRIVAVLDFWIFVILMIKLISLLNPFYGYEHEYYLYNIDDNQILYYDFSIFTYLFIIFVFLYINYYLKESTYGYKIYEIYQWLAINTILLSIHVIAVTFITFKYNYIYINILYYSTPICIVHVIQIYIVYCFYGSQLSANNNCLSATMTCNSNNNNNNNNNNSNTNVASTTATVLTTQCSSDGYATDQTLRMHAARQFCNGTGTAGVPTALINYPQILNLGTGVTPQDQAQLSGHPQEYFNPPPYSLSYELRGGSSH